MTIYYTGIGSRRSPPDVLELITGLATKLRETGAVLRSGHAEGTDQAFELGAGRKAEIYLPWDGFNGSYGWNLFELLISPESSRAAFTIAERFHPNWSACGQGARKLHARNVHQILGPDVENPVLSSYVLCWTPDGSLDGAGRDTGETGGTGQALRIATAYGVPVYNLARQDHRALAENWVNTRERSVT